MGASTVFIATVAVAFTVVVVVLVVGIVAVVIIVVVVVAIENDVEIVRRIRLQEHGIMGTMEIPSLSFYLFPFPSSTDNGRSHREEEVKVGEEEEEVKEEEEEEEVKEEEEGEEEEEVGEEEKYSDQLRPIDSDSTRDRRISVSYPIITCWKFESEGGILSKLHLVTVVPKDSFRFFGKGRICNRVERDQQQEQQQQQQRQWRRV
ncbi:hypothetical protein HZH68_000595 [Vespula germanica]|uniref:Uncharacterized protein n=1 Tax=Vespula germanica TaxID=30212 RepID=A0A834NU42_VESGE|nr:hypothetical protein HZH68_000595 [Vespula germanica]